MDDPLATLAPSDPTWNPAQTVPPEAMMAAQNPAQNIPPTQQTVDVNTPPPADQNAPIPSQLTSLIPSETAPNNPDIERHFHEAKWRDILRTVGTIMGGDKTLHVKKDTDGNITVTHDPSTEGEKWGRIAAAALGGAAQGLANSQGPGGAARAAAAGTQYGLQLPQQRQQEADAQATAEQKRMMNNAQVARLNQEVVLAAWDNKHLEPEYQQKQGERALAHAKTLQEMGATPIALGVKDPKQLMTMAKGNPQAVDAHLGKNGEILYNEPDGEGGVNFYSLPGSVASQRTTADDHWEEIHIDPKDPSQTISKPHVTLAGQETNGDQLKRQMAVSVANDKVLSGVAKANKEKEPTTFEGAVIAKSKLLYPDDPAKAMTAAVKEIKETEKRRFAAVNLNLQSPGITQPGTQITELIKPGGKFGAGTVEGTNAQALATGDQTMDQIPKRLAKGAPTPQEYFAAAEAYSQQLYGLGFSPTMITAEKKQFDNIKEQGVLNGIDRMIGVGGEAGYLDKVVSLGKAAGVGPNAPLNEISLALKKRFGEAAASNFNTALGEVQRSLPQLIGNPLLGGSDTDMKLRQAQDMFGKHPTAANLDSTATVLRDLMQGALHSYSRNNRFFQRRYGMEGSYAAQYSPTQPGAAPGANPGQAARQPATPTTFQMAPKQPPNPPSPGSVFGTGPQGLGWYPEGTK